MSLEGRVTVRISKLRIVERHIQEVLESFDPDECHTMRDVTTDLIRAQGKLGREIWDLRELLGEDD